MRGERGFALESKVLSVTRCGNGCCVEFVALSVQYGYNALVLHGGQDQTDREFTIQEFKASPLSLSHTPVHAPPPFHGYRDSVRVSSRRSLRIFEFVFRRAQKLCSSQRASPPGVWTFRRWFW